MFGGRVSDPPAFRIGASRHPSRPLQRYSNPTPKRPCLPYGIAQACFPRDSRRRVRRPAASLGTVPPMQRKIGRPALLAIRYSHSATSDGLITPLLHRTIWGLVWKPTNPSLAVRTGAGADLRCRACGIEGRPKAQLLDVVRVPAASRPRSLRRLIDVLPACSLARREMEIARCRSVLEGHERAHAGGAAAWRPVADRRETPTRVLSRASRDVAGRNPSYPSECGGKCLSTDRRLDGLMRATVSCLTR
jgi:hypothetical protein